TNAGERPAPGSRPPIRLATNRDSSAIVGALNRISASIPQSCAPHHQVTEHVDEKLLEYGTRDLMKAQPPRHTAPAVDCLATFPSSPVARFHRTDDSHCHWLENRDEPQVREFLEAANVACDAWMAPLDALTDQLYQGHLARRELAVDSLRTALDHFTYWSETAADADYPVWWRHP